MTRVLKRVPLDFDWPLKKVWGGYINPFSSQCSGCSACDGTGSSPNARRFHEEWYGNAPFDPAVYGVTPITVDHPSIQAFARRNCEQNPSFYGRGDGAIRREARRLFQLWRGQWSHHLSQADVDALVEAGRLWDFTRVPRNAEQEEIVRRKVAGGDNRWLPEDNGYVPTADEVNAWSMMPGQLGHDGINAFVCIAARCKRENVEPACQKCGGDGTVWPSPEIERQHDTWEPAEPPSGDGYQVWGTTSEGDPQSPVFATLDELCSWCSKNSTVFADQRATAEQWRELLLCTCASEQPEVVS